MRVQRQTKRGEVSNRYLFLIYDETKTFDEDALEKARFDMRFPDAEFRERVFQNSLEMLKNLYGKAYGHPRLCYFTVKDNDITFEFDSEKEYSSGELKQMMRLANRAKNRCK